MASEQHISKEEADLRAFQETANRYTKLLSLKKKGTPQKSYYRYTRNKNKAYGLPHTLAIVLNKATQQFEPFALVTTGNSVDKSPVHPCLHQAEVIPSEKSKVKSAFRLSSEEDLQHILSGKPSTHLVKMIKVVVGTDAEAIQKRLSNEMEMAKQFYGHDQLFFFMEYDSKKDKQGKTRKKYLLFMPRIEGVEFFHYFTEELRNLSTLERFRLMRACVVMAGNLERAGIVHTDLKPENMICEVKRDAAGLDFEIKPIDFETSFMENTGPVFKSAGTPGYISPELHRYNISENKRPKEISYQTDMYSIGCVLLNILREGQNENPIEKMGFKYKNTFHHGSFLGLPLLVGLEGKLHRNTFVYDHMKRFKGTPIISFIESMLAIELAKRPSAAEALKNIDEIIASEEKNEACHDAAAALPTSAEEEISDRTVNVEVENEGSTGRRSSAFFSSEMPSSIAYFGSVAADSRSLPSEVTPCSARQQSPASFFETHTPPPSPVVPVHAHPEAVVSLFQ